MCVWKFVLKFSGPIFLSISVYIGSFNRDTRNLLDHSSHVVKVTSIKFVVNCLVVYSKLPWKIIVLSVQIIKFYYQNQCSVRETFRALHNFYPRHNRPAESTIRRLVCNQPTPVRRRNTRSAENIAAVRESVRQNPRRSISHLSQELGEFCVGIWVCIPIKFNWPRNLR